MTVRGWAPALCVVLLGSGAWGRQDGGGSLRAEGEPEHHAWIATRMLEGEGAALFHLPPREAGPGFGAADAGVARPAQTLGQQPWRLAWWGRRVYLLYASSQARELDVFSLRAAPTGVGGFWATDPATGAAAEPTLRVDGTFEDAACAAESLLVLTSEAEGARLWRLAGGGWEEVALPDSIGGADVLRLVAGSALPTLVALEEGRSVRWRLMPDAGWSAAALAPLESGSPGLTCFEGGGDVCVAFQSADGRVEAWSLGPGLGGRLASVETSGDPLSAAPLGGGTRLAVLCLERNDDATGRLEPVNRWELIEVSLATGRELYRGGPRSGSPISGSDVRWLSIGMVALTLGVLFYLLRPVPSRDVMTLPPGMALAEPGRRLAGGLLDAALIAGAISIAFKVPIQHVLLAVPLFESAEGVLAFGAFVASGTTYGTLCEWLTGRTIGKTLAGCRVVSVLPGRPRLGLMRSGVRNLFRWGLAPWAVLGLGARDGRHRGDLVAGAAVVIEVEGEDEPEDGAR